MSLIDSIKNAIGKRSFSEKVNFNPSTQLETEVQSTSKLDPKILYSVFGASGTNFWDWYIQEEYNSLFQWRAAYETYDEMARSDSTIYKMLMGAIVPILSAERIVRPWQDKDGNVSDKDKEIADFIEYNLWETMEWWFEQFLSECLNMLRDGVSVFEKVYQIKDWLICVKKLAVRLPKSIEKRQTKDGTAGITQTLAIADKWQSVEDTAPSIPAEKLLIFTNRKEWKNYAGVSVLRPIAKNWIAKKALENFELIGYETQFKWVKKLRVPAWMANTDKNAALNSIAGYSVWNDNVIILPWTKDEYDFEFVTMDLQAAQWIQETIKRHDNKITDVMLAIFMKLGESERGSYGMSESGMGFFYNGLKVVCKQVCDVLNKYFIRELVDLNFPDVEYYPEITVWKLWDLDINIWSQALQRVSQTWLLTSDLETEQRVRENLGMPNKSEEEYKQSVEERKQALKNMEDKKNDVSATEHNIFSELRSVVDYDNYYGSDIPSDVKKKSFSVKFNFRPLTFAEQKMDLPQLKKTLDKYEKKIVDELITLSQTQKAAILEQIKKAVENNDITALGKIKVPWVKKLSDLILWIKKDVFNFGKDSASSEMWFDVPKTSTETKAYMELESKLLAQKTVDILESQTKSVVTQMIGKNNWSITSLAAATAVQEVGQSIDRVVEQLSQSVKTLSVISSFNVGLSVVYNANIDKIYAYQYSAILDGRTTDRCLSLDGRVFLPWSQDAINYKPPQHINCRSRLVGILIDETFKPAVTGVPKYIDPVTDISKSWDLKRPYIRKDSPAIKQLEQELKERQTKLEEYKAAWLYPNRQEQHQNRIDQLLKALPKE